MFATKDEIIWAVMDAVEAMAGNSEFDFHHEASSSVSCSTYFSVYRENDDGELQELNVRISDHAQHVDRSRVDLNIGLLSDHGAYQIKSEEVFRGENDDIEGIDPIGFEVEQEEIDRIAAIIIAEAMKAEFE